MNYASIDIGSNTILLLIASLGAKGEICPLLEKAEITRLGEKLDDSGLLQEEAMERTLKSLRQFTDLCHRNGVERIACVGTEALRRARNSQEFVQRVRKNCGFKVEIITGTKEAELAYLSAALDFSEKYPNLVVLDIGGGSTELIWQTENNGDTAKLQTLSMKMGSVRLTEQCLTQDPVNAGEYQAMQEIIDGKLEKDLDGLKLPHSPMTLVGLAGTVTTLSMIDQKMPHFYAPKIQGASLKLSSLEKIIDEMKIKPLQERKKITGMEPKRADVLLAGATILKRVMEKLCTQDLLVSDRGIRYGLFYQRFVSAN